MLKMCCLALNEKDIVKFKLDFAAFDYFLEFFRTYKYEDVPLIKLYYNILLLKLADEPENRISFILDTIRTNNELFSRHDKYSAYVYICNYYHERISEGEKEYEKQLYFVFKEMASMDICDVVNDYISQQFYINTVNF